MQVLFPNHHSSQWQWLSDMLPLTSKAKQVLQSWGYQQTSTKQFLQNTTQYKNIAKLLHGCLIEIQLTIHVPADTPIL